MIGRWTRRLVWGPYEGLCRRFPLIPFEIEATEQVEGVVRLRVHNAVVRALARLSGGYDYSVSYLVDDELIVDTGFPWARRALEKTLRSRPAERPIRVVVNTHYHEDHTGNNDLFRELFGARILAHPRAVREIRFPSHLPWYRRFLFGPVPTVDAEAAPDEIRTSRFRLRILELPGHCPGHVCLFEPERGWLFGGDLYIAPDLDAQLSDVNGPDWIESLDKAIDLHAEFLFDGHGLVVRGEAEVQEHLRRKRAFLATLRDQVRTESRSARSVREITRAVFAAGSLVNRLSLHEGWLSLLTASDFSRSNLVRTFLADEPESAQGSAPKVLPVEPDPASRPSGPRI